MDIFVVAVLGSLGIFIFALMAYRREKKRLDIQERLLWIEKDLARARNSCSLSQITTRGETDRLKHLFMAKKDLDDALILTRTLKKEFL